MENYDPNQPVCQNQDDYNQAFRQALKYNYKQNMKNARPAMWVAFSLYVVLTFWALMLAMRVSSNPERTEHLFFALVGGPVYVLAYYLSGMNMKN